MPSQTLYPALLCSLMWTVNLLLASKVLVDNLRCKQPGLQGPPCRNQQMITEWPQPTAEDRRRGEMREVYLPRYKYKSPSGKINDHRTASEVDAGRAEFIAVTGLYSVLVCLSSRCLSYLGSRMRVEVPTGEYVLFTKQHVRTRTLYAQSRDLRAKTRSTASCIISVEFVSTAK